MRMKKENEMNNIIYHYSKINASKKIIFFKFTMKHKKERKKQNKHREFNNRKVKFATE